MSLQTTTIDNIMIDAVMFGVAQKKSGILHIIPNSEDELIGLLQSFFKKHLVYIKLKKQGAERFNYSTFFEIFKNVYISSNISSKTKSAYCGKLYNWFEGLGLINVDSDLSAVIVAPSSKTVLSTASFSRRRGYNIGGHTLFWGQTSPEKMFEAYRQIKNGNSSYSTLKSNGYRNAIELLTAANALQRDKDTLVLKLSLAETIANISNSDTIRYTRVILSETPNIKSLDLGNLLSEHYSRKWTVSSQKRYGNALINWVKYLDSHHIDDKM